MKKLFKLSLLTLLLGLFCTGFSACKDCAHDYGEWKTVRASTCLEEGEEARTCTRCDKTERRSLDALEHEYGAWQTMTTATCCTAGRKERVCSLCLFAETEIIPILTTHELVEYKRVEPTCTRDGSISLICDCSGKFERIRIPHLGGHKDENDNLRCDTCGEALYEIPVELNCQGGASAETMPYALVSAESGGLAEVTMGEHSILRESNILYPAEGYAGNVVCNNFDFLYEWEAATLTGTYLYPISLNSKAFGRVEKVYLTVADTRETAVVVTQSHFVNESGESVSNQRLLYWGKRIDPNDLEATADLNNQTIIPARFHSTVNTFQYYADEEGNILSTEQDYPLLLTEPIVHLHVYYEQIS